MQITNVEVVSTELNLQHPVQMAGHPEIDRITAIFVHIVTRQGADAWGCTAVAPGMTDETPAQVIRACLTCADRARDLHPTNVEYSLAELTSLAADTPSALCAFDLAFHDLLGLAAGMPLYRLLGGYRDRIQTSVTIDVAPVRETVEAARRRAAEGFRILKIKGGLDAERDVHRVEAVRRALPNLTLRLDADGGYTVQQALDVARVLEQDLEMLEQPTPEDDPESLRQVTRLSPVPILADQSVRGPRSALKLATDHAADGLSVKLALCGGLLRARQVDTIARAARLTTMIGCVIEPALLTSAGLSFALSSPNVRYGDLDGSFNLVGDPSVPGFVLEEGWLIATDVPGLGYKVAL